MPRTIRNSWKFLAAAIALSLTAPALAQNEETWLSCELTSTRDESHVTLVLRFTDRELFSFSEESSEMHDMCRDQPEFKINRDCSVTADAITQRLISTGNYEADITTKVNRLTRAITRSGYDRNAYGEKPARDVEESGVCSRIEDPRPKASF